ncbi:DUF4249 family protein [Hymenobacter sp. BT559]|uniref:DUF4249 family protein n=1 Tax=Hymenobacter sp. BT559 TaxID=2795729 RepID=UPI0018ED42AE|nr:DUF4249 family protein [Hymenobacter sp. BT559]MBJ6144011.1 DUF4249 family protein [Hymenobacter sp. BT559]
MKKVLFLGSLALLASCEAVVNVPTPAHTPQLSLLYTLSNQPITAEYNQYFYNRNPYVSSSLGTLATTRLQGRLDATVELRDASGQVVEQFKPDTSAHQPFDYRYGTYLPVRGYVGQPGQAYTLRASAPGLAPLEATLTLPAPATIDAASASFVTKPQVVAPGPYPFIYDYYGQLSFAILDAAATTDYYVAYARVFDAAGRPWGYVYQDNSGRNTEGPDIKLNRFDLSSTNDVYKILPVSDEGRNGQRLNFSHPVGLSYSGSYDPQRPNIPPPAFLEITVSSLPPATYDFYQSMQRYYDTNGNPFAEPAPLRSNLQGGYGLFGGATDTKFRIRL